MKITISNIISLRHITVTFITHGTSSQLSEHACIIQFFPLPRYF